MIVLKFSRLLQCEILEFILMATVSVVTCMVEFIFGLFAAFWLKFWLMWRIHQSVFYFFTFKSQRLLHWFWRNLVIAPQFLAVNRINLSELSPSTSGDIAWCHNIDWLSKAWWARGITLPYDWTEAPCRTRMSTTSRICNYANCPMRHVCQLWVISFFHFRGA